MKLDLYQEADLFAALKPEWNDLLERSTAGSVFSTWEWASTWWGVYQPGELWIITCRDTDDRLVGIAPWFITSSPERVVRTIGCEDVADYLDLLVDSDHAEAVLDHLASFLQEHHADFDQISLCNIPETSLGSTLFPTVLEEYGFSVNLNQEDVCPIIELPETWDEYLAQLDKRNRHELRRKLRRAYGNNLEVDWYVVGPEHDLDAEVIQFLEMMAESDPEKADFCADPQNQEFFKRIAALTLEAGWLWLCFLTVNGERAAAYFNFDYKGHILVYNSGLRQEYSSLSPGIVLLAYSIQYAIENDHAIFDFLRGDETYKYRMGGQDTAVMTLVAEAVES